MESGLCGEVDYSLLVIEIDMLPAPNYQWYIWILVCVCIQVVNDGYI